MAPGLLKGSWPFPLPLLPSLPSASLSNSELPLSPLTPISFTLAPFSVLIFHHHDGRVCIPERVPWGRWLLSDWKRRQTGGLWHQLRCFWCGPSEAEAGADQTRTGKGTTKSGRCHCCCSRNDPAKMETVCLKSFAVSAAPLNIDHWGWLHLLFLYTRYCDFVRKDHVKLLKSCSVISFKGYLIWYHKTHPRAQRLNTCKSV